MILLLEQRDHMTESSITNEGPDLSIRWPQGFTCYAYVYLFHRSFHLKQHIYIVISMYDSLVASQLSPLGVSVQELGFTIRDTMSVNI